MAFRIARLFFRVLLWVVVLSIPALGVWLSSSLAAYANGPRWLICLAGTMLFPLLPLAWELRGQRRRSRRKAHETQSPAKGQAKTEPLIQLSFWDRMVLRTLVINLVFLTPLLYFFPKPSFRALATRGDWFLQYARPELAGAIRPHLFSGVDKLNWIYGLSRNNPHERYQDPDPPPPPKPREVVQAPNLAQETSKTKPWPVPLGLSPVVTSMPSEVQSDYATVARYIASKLSSPREQLKAIHDFVIWHLQYDYESLARGEYPDQQASAVFSTKKAVCAGYSRLMSDMGKAIGLDVRYITGQVRNEDGNLADSGHAWNAAKIDGQWQLIDATWDDQDHRKHPDRTRKSGYETTYFMTPPRTFLLDHFPKDPRWQLIEPPIHLQDFLRQPMLQPDFVAAGFSLLDPNLRAQVQSDTSRWSFSISNPEAHKLIAQIAAKEQENEREAPSEPCRVSGVKEVEIDCPLSVDTSVVRLYGGPPNEDNSYPMLARFEVHYR